MQSAVRSTARRHLLALVLVALWLGWTGTGLAGLHRVPAGDPALLEPVLAQLPPALRTAGRPLALRLGPACACRGGERAWQALAAPIAARGGQVRTLDLPAATAAGLSLLVLDAAGRPVYSGPLSPPPGTCGGDPADPARWLPPLLDGGQPPLHLPPSPCSC